MLVPALDQYNMQRLTRPCYKGITMMALQLVTSPIAAPEALDSVPEKSIEPVGVGWRGLAWVGVVGGCAISYTRRQMGHASGVGWRASDAGFFHEVGCYPRLGWCSRRHLGELAAIPFSSLSVRSAQCSCRTRQAPEIVTAEGWHTCSTTRMSHKQMYDEPQITWLFVACTVSWCAGRLCCCVCDALCCVVLCCVVLCCDALCCVVLCCVVLCCVVMCCVVLCGVCVCVYA